MMKPLQKLIPFLALSLFSIGGYAQGLVKGIIVDAEAENAPLIGATVVIEGTTIGSVTDFNGAFTLKVNKPKVTLTFSYLGYIDQSLDVELTGGAEKDLGTIKLKSSTVGLDEIQVTTSFVRDRRTPVAVSTIDPITIETKLGTQEFPEILKTTPSVYATKAGGGFGDSRIMLRGFDSNNIGILINGIPINDMESGKVYWSNWTSLADVTMSQQVQRGLGASKLGLSSVGGTINIITRSTDAEKGGNVYAGFGNDGYYKQSFLVSTGLTDNGWAATFFGSHNQGNGYIKATNYEAWTYFFNVSKVINDRHRLVFTGFGSPQWHNQRNMKHTIQEYREHPDGIRWNSDYGYRNGKIYNTGYAYNYYHKPQFSLSHYWKIGDLGMLSTQAYASKAKGGGRRVSGSNSQWLSRDYTTGAEYPGITKLTPEGYYDYDAVIAANAANANGSTCIISNAINSHDWYGFLSTLTSEFGEFNFTAGYDMRYYKGYHGTEIEDLLGGKFFLDNSNINREKNLPLKKGDLISYYNTGEVLWNGLFAQAEYANEEYSGFLSLAIAQKAYRRKDFFKYSGDEQLTDWVKYMPWNVKAGFNYKISDGFGVFVNGGYVINAPTFSNAFLNNTNEINENVLNEEIITFEGGVNYNIRSFEVKVNGYVTNWNNRAFLKSVGQETANISGVNALHQGVEIEGTYRPNKKLTVKGMFSIGDWKWKNDVHAVVYNENQDSVGAADLYIKGLHVGNSAQTTGALSIDFEILPKLTLGGDMTYFGRNFADYDPNGRMSALVEKKVWQMPDATIVDLNFNYKFKIGNLNATFYGNVTNLLNQEYIADATDGTNHDEFTSTVWYGFGRTWSTGLRVKF